MSSDLETALRQFEAVEANLKKLERIWEETQEFIPEGIVFSDGGQEAVTFEEKWRAWGQIVECMPTIDGWEMPNNLLHLDDIAQCRMDAQESGMIECIISAEQAIQKPGEDLREYRFHFNTKRRALARKRVQVLVDDADGLLEKLRTLSETKKPGASIKCEDWEALQNRVAQIDTLLGSSVSRPARWGDLHRHLHFAQTGDLDDILKHDWPQVKAGIEGGLYHKDEPLPVEVADLGEIVAREPAGAVATKLRWDDLSDEDFERLLFCLISDAKGYENPQWLTKTNAPDRGRDLAVERVRSDSLGEVKRERVIIQCKHWRTRSVAPPDVTATRDQMELWEPPPVDVLIIATSGMFTTNAVDLIEKHNNARKRPAIEMWPHTHLERRLAERPHLIAEFNLR